MIDETRALALAVVMLLSIVGGPVSLAGTSAAAENSAISVTDPGFYSIDNDGAGDQLSVAWATSEAASGTQSIQFESSSDTTDYGVVVVPANFKLEDGDSLSWQGYRVSGSNVPARDEVFLYIDDNEDGDVDAAIWYHYGTDSGPKDQWVTATLGLNNSEQSPSNMGQWQYLDLDGSDHSEDINITKYYGETIEFIGLGVGTTSNAHTVDNYVDDLEYNDQQILDEDTGVLVAGHLYEVFQGTQTVVQDNIDGALPGTSIEVRPGVYPGRINIDKDVDVSGSGQGTTFLKADSSDVEKNHDPVIQIGGNVTLDSLTIRRNVTSLSQDKHTKAIGITAIGGPTNSKLNNVTVRLLDATNNDSFGNAIYVHTHSADDYPVDAELNNVDVRSEIGPNSDGFGGAAVAVLATQENVNIQIIQSNLHDSLRGYYTIDNGAPIDGEITQTTFSANRVHILDIGKSLDMGETLRNNGNSFDKAVVIDRPDNSLLHTVWSSIQDAIDASVDGDRIGVLPGTYQESITIDEEIDVVGLAGPQSTVIDADGAPTAVELAANNVSIRGFNITGTTTSGQFSGQAILGGGLKNVIVENIIAFDNPGKSIDISSSQDIILREVVVRNGGWDGITLYKDEDVLIQNVTAVNNGHGPVVDGYPGAAQDADSGVYIKGINVRVDGLETHNNNGEGLYLHIEDISDIVDNTDAFDSVDEVDPAQHGALLTDIDASGNEQGVDLWTNEFRVQLRDSSIHDNNQANDLDHADGVAVTGNNTVILFNDIENNTVDIHHYSSISARDDAEAGDTFIDGFVFAGLNWYGDARAAELTLEGGSIAYDPFLTAPKDDVNQGITEVQQFGHDFTMESGSVYALATPGPVQGTVDDVLNEFEGTLFAYDAEDDDWLTGADVADMELDSLDVILVVPTGETDARAVTDYVDSDDANTAPGEHEVEAGWNLVGAPQNGTAETAFAASSADPARIQHQFDEPGSQPYGAGQFSENFASYTFTGTAGQGPVVSPYVGYWVYANEDGSIAANIPEGVSVRGSNGEFDLLNFELGT